MSLEPLKFMLDSQLSRCEQDFRVALSFTGTKEKNLRRHHLEGALSDAWQAYCTFVRYVLIRSSVGTITSSGTVLPASVTPANWERVSHIAIRSASGKAPQLGITNNSLRKEPTWGDSSKIVSIVNSLAPSNANTLKAYLAGGLDGPKHCQIVRNACAHRNTQTGNEVVVLASKYLASHIKHPTDAMLWKVTSSSQFAFLAWLDDMKAISEGVIA